MSALPRPDLPPGPHRDLVVELHDLHHRAGWPSLRTLAARTGVSHTTVSKVFSAPALRTWGTLELVVEAMGGDTGEFHRLWLTATDPSDVAPTPAPRIAGRRAELDVVRRHLEGGAGLLLVTGEAGMGKTTVVETAVAQVRDSVLVACGRCLPLSTEVPLLPIADALRQLASTADGPTAEALRACPPHVREAVSVLLPEWSTDAATVPDADDRWLRQRLFLGLAELCHSVARSRPFAFVLEDLHWADGLTLDLVEHLVRDSRTRVLGSWRTDDPDVTEHHRDWFARMRRDADTVPLEPLTAEETEEQLRILRPDATTVDAARIHARSHGQPLFTEQLAQADAGHPTYLDDLLDERVGRLSGAQWRVASVLGVADRPLSEDDVAAAARIEEVGVHGVLRELGAVRLAEVMAGRVQLRHPLLAEAVRRRLLPGEVADVHRAVASVLSTGADVEPAEVARHWQGAGDAEEELAWQVRAARAASERHAGMQAAEHWSRVLALWPPDAAEVGSPPTRRHEALAGIAAQLDLAGRPRDAVPVLESELALPDPPHLYDVAERADLLHLLARCNSSQFVPGDVGLRLVEQSIELYRTLPPTPGLAAALTWRGTELEWHGRRTDATLALAEAARVAAQAGDRQLERTVRAQWVWQLAALGHDGALDEMDRLVRDFGADSNLSRNLYVAIRHTDILLMAGRPADEVVRAARPTLEQAAQWEVTTSRANVLMSNVAQALRRAGRVREAVQRLQVDTSKDVPDGVPFLHLERAILEALLGHEEEAQRRLRAFDVGRHEVVDAVLLTGHLHFAAWTGDPADGIELAQAVLLGRHDEVAPGIAGDLLVLTARTAADAAVTADLPGREAVARSLDDLRSAMHHDPFSRQSVVADRACLPQWNAERQRLLGRDTVEAWAEAASTWRHLDRPHDEAYCLWRAAQAALRAGQGTAAARLLTRAAARAGEHVPLSRAIAETTAAGRRSG